MKCEAAIGALVIFALVYFALLPCAYAMDRSVVLFVRARYNCSTRLALTLSLGTSSLL